MYKTNYKKTFFRLLVCISIFLNAIMIATLLILYIKNAPPQTLLIRMGFNIPPGKDWTLISWNSSLEQLNYDADIVFIGDSLTRGENFQEYFPEKNIINLGLSGDSLSGISERTYIINNFSPEKIFVEGGVNSLASDNVDNLATLYESMIQDMIANNPRSDIFIQSILPISRNREKRGLTNENIVSLNKKLQEICERLNITYIDLYSAYVLDGEMNPEYTIDGIHLKDEYKTLWLQQLIKYVD